MERRGLIGVRRRMLTRRSFLADSATAVLAGALAKAWVAPAAESQVGQVKKRKLGKTGLMVSEIGWGGHSWEYPRVPDGKGGMRQVSDDEAMEMIAYGLDVGVNFFDADTAIREHTVPAKALARLQRKGDVIICLRLCHKSKGIPEDKDEIQKFLDERLKAWDLECVDLMMASMTTETYWEMSYTIEAFDKAKKDGKIRFSGFGSHFTPENYIEAIGKYGDAFDICSMPYNCRHRAAEEIFATAEKHNLGIVTIKPFARGSLLEELDLQGKDKDVPRQMIAFVLRNEYVDCCLAGCHTVAQAKLNFSASWTGITDDQAKSLTEVAAAHPSRHPEWLERGWLIA